MSIPDQFTATICSLIESNRNRLQQIVDTLSSSDEFERYNVTGQD